MKKSVTFFRKNLYPTSIMQRTSFNEIQYRPVLSKENDSWITLTLKNEKKKGKRSRKTNVTSRHKAKKYEKTNDFSGVSTPKVKESSLLLKYSS